MQKSRVGRLSVLAPFIGAVMIAAVLPIPVVTAAAGTPLTVAQAIGRQGASATVRGYVVGQPTATNTVVTSSFPSDYAIAIADSPGETSTSRMLYVQVTSGFRAQYGLRSNPGLMGDRLDVTGKLAAYFSHPGLTSPTAIAPASSNTPPTTTAPPTTTPPTTTPPPGGDYDSTYYRTAIGLRGAALKDELHEIIDDNAGLAYSEVWNALKVTDQDPANPGNVILFYSGRTQSKSANGGGADDWNREHVWAKSHGDFGTVTGPGTDIHHLRPTDVTVNSLRGNKDFDNGGSAVGEAPGNYTDSDSWEPRDAVKGDVARMIFYMSVRYEGGDGFADLEMNNAVNNGTAPYLGRVSVLLAWHAQDPPDSFERRRNQVIYDQFQHNRNPFIDHPEWAAAIWN